MTIICTLLTDSSTVVDQIQRRMMHATCCHDYACNATSRYSIV